MQPRARFFCFRQGRKGRSSGKSKEESSSSKSSKIVKGLRKGLPIYILKLNKPEKLEEGENSDWLGEYQDVFPEELTSLPPERELVHEIELIPGAQPVARAPYKMSPSEALELKNWLTQLF